MSIEQFWLHLTLLFIVFSFTVIPFLGCNFTFISNIIMSYQRKQLKCTFFLNLDLILKLDSKLSTYLALNDIVESITITLLRFSLTFLVHMDYLLHVLMTFFFLFCLSDCQYFAPQMCSRKLYVKSGINNTPSKTRWFSSLKFPAVKYYQDKLIFNLS